MATRDELDAALKDGVVPALRQMGFRGSLPHFRRRHEGRIDLLSIQHSQPSGGKFVIEIAKAPPEGIITSWGKQIAPNKVKASDVTGSNVFRNRLRLGSSPKDGVNDHWFSYSTVSRNELENLVNVLVGLVETQAEPWWNDGYAWWDDT